MAKTNYTLIKVDMATLEDVASAVCNNARTSYAAATRFNKAIRKLNKRQNLLTVALAGSVLYLADKCRKLDEDVYRLQIKAKQENKEEKTTEGE